MTDGASGSRVYIGHNCIQVGDSRSQIRAASADRDQCGTKRKLGNVLDIARSFDTR